MFGAQKLLVGVIHLPPLPGYPESPGMDAVLDKALADLSALETGPVEAALVENENEEWTSAQRASCVTGRRSVPTRFSCLQIFK